jgi:hypothetical protein
LTKQFVLRERKTLSKEQLAKDKKQEQELNAKALSKHHSNGKI